MQWAFRAMPAAVCLGLPAAAVAAERGAGLSDVGHWAFVLVEAALLLGLIAVGRRLSRLRQGAPADAVPCEQRLERIANAANGGFLRIALQPSLPMLTAYDGFWNLLGYAADAGRRPRNFADLLDSQDAAAFFRQYEGASCGTPVKADLRLRGGEGAWLALSLRGILEADAAGDVTMACLVLDRSDQSHMHEELEEEKERYRLILEQSQDIIVDVDLERHRFQCSSNFRRKFGEDAVPGFDADGHLDASRSIHPDDVPAFQEIRRRIHAGAPAAFAVVRLRTAEGRFIWCRIQVTRVSKPDAPLRLVGKIMDIDESVRQRAQLERLSQRDTLTDLLNKTAFTEKVNASMPAQPQGECCDALVFLDLDNFKALNDTLGHVKGDEALVRTAKVIRSVFRNADAVGRFGGDEFCIFVRGITREALRRRAVALRSGLHMFFEQDGQAVEVTSSIGVYVFDGTEPSYDTALERADTAQYHAKQAGKNTFRFYDEVAGDWGDGFTPDIGGPQGKGAEAPADSR